MISLSDNQLAIDFGMLRSEIDTRVERAALSAIGNTRPRETI
jgi:hypothetical protein